MNNSIVINQTILSIINKEHYQDNAGQIQSSSLSPSVLVITIEVMEGIIHNPLKLHLKPAILHFTGTQLYTMSH